MTMAMKVLLLVAIGTIYTASFTPTLAKDHKAKILLKFHQHSKSYELNQDVLQELTELSSATNSSYCCHWKRESWKIYDAEPDQRHLG